MTNLVRNLHTAIRRYCIEQYEYWHQQYKLIESSGKERSGYDYSDEALDIFPRYNVMNAILTEIERLRPEDFSSLGEAKEIFKLAAQTADDDFTRINTGRIEAQAKSDERNKLGGFIHYISENDLLNVEPLFFRRVLSDKESKVLWDKIRSRWNLPKGYWYPLINEKPERSEAFQDYYFETEFGYERLREILSQRGTENVFELREFGIEYEQDLSSFEPYYSGAEGYWFDDSFDWIIYASHESSITIAGQLLKDIQTAWPNWRKRIWTSPFFD